MKSNNLKPEVYRWSTRLLSAAKSFKSELTGIKAYYFSPPLAGVFETYPNNYPPLWLKTLDGGLFVKKHF
jgi:hypothetical protein